VAIGVADLLSIVGEEISGSPVLAPLDCPNGGDGLEAGVIPAVDAGYLLR
jgi:hypothetical protein